jgi:hypothetical protein
LNKEWERLSDFGEGKTLKLLIYSKELPLNRQMVAKLLCSFGKYNCCFGIKIKKK